MKQEDINVLHNAKHDGKQSGNPSTRSHEHIVPAVTVHVLQNRYKTSIKHGVKQAHAKDLAGSTITNAQMANPGIQSTGITSQSHTQSMTARAGVLLNNATNDIHM